ncbi:hypothetical protein RhiirB3_449586 [Rhizophagus irregularis]|nr:hypothetical protein RhiirB3_449586 [Rhizophagus irregularis]
MTDSSSLAPTSHDDDSFNILSNVDTIEESNENMSHVTSHSIQRHDDKIDINQENVVMSEFSYFYRPCNDFQIYHIVCKEKTSNEIVSRLLNNCLYSSHYLFSNDLFVFYFQQPNDKRIYQIACEMQDEHRQQQQQQRHQEFSDRHKENLEFHLKQFLFNYLTPKEDNFIDENNL